MHFAPAKAEGRLGNRLRAIATRISIPAKGTVAHMRGPGCTSW